MTISDTDRKSPDNKSQSKGVDLQEAGQEKILLNTSVGLLDNFSWSFYTVLEGLYINERRQQVQWIAPSRKDLSVGVSSALTQFPGV